MSTSRGIFETFPNQPPARPDSPFAVAQDAPASPFTPVASPFTAVKQESPFTVVDEPAESAAFDSVKPVRLPERRKTDSPFQVAEPSEGFGFEAPAKPFGTAPFAAPAAAPQAAVSPFSVEPARAPAGPPQAAVAAFQNWQDAQPVPAAPAPAASPFDAAPVASFAAPASAPALSAPVFAPTPAPPAAAVPSFAPVAAPAAAPAAPAADDAAAHSDSFAIRQLELRAIFGVDREMNADEILQRSRALPGMRNIARVATQDMATIEALKSLLPNLGFGTGALKLYAGSVPLEFIREGSVLLAVQTDGGFAPGVRETLMIVARELGRLS